MSNEPNKKGAQPKFFNFSCAPYISYKIYFNLSYFTSSKIITIEYQQVTNTWCKYECL